MKVRRTSRSSRHLDAAAEPELSMKATCNIG